MKMTVKLPKVADSVDEVAVIEILVEVGDSVAEQQAILMVETDKASVEVPSPVAGTVVEVLVAIDDEIETGAPVLVLETP